MYSVVTNYPRSWKNDLALPVLAEDPDSVPSAHVEAGDCLWLQFQWVQCPHPTPMAPGAHTHTSIHISKAIIYMKINGLFKPPKLRK